MNVWSKDVVQEEVYSEGSLAGLPTVNAASIHRSPLGKNRADKLNDTYRVVFWGQCARGYERALVARAFAKRFKVTSSRQLARLFSGKVLTLKKGLSENQAEKFVGAIQSVGGVCRKESERKDYFSETEFKVRNTVSFLEDDFDFNALSLAPKDEFSPEY